MRIKNTAFAYNVTVDGHSNSDWGTEIGQSSKHTFTAEGFPEIVNAMVYYKIKDEENLKVILGKGSRTLKPFSEYTDNELVLASLFPKVFVNGTELKGQKFIMYIIKETNALTKTGTRNVHLNRCALKFSNSLEYRKEKINRKCIDAISDFFGLTSEGSWVILEINIKNEDELHFTGFPLGPEKKVYQSAEERNKHFDSLLSNPDSTTKGSQTKVLSTKQISDIESTMIPAIKTKPFVIVGGISGTGKSMMVKKLAFATCPMDGTLDTSETAPGNYLLISVKPNWHDASDLIGFHSSINRNYYVTDFMRFLVKAKIYEERNVPFFICLDEMNLAPVEEYFSDFLSVIESRKRLNSGKIVTDPLIPASVFTENYSDDFNIFMSLGLELVQNDWKADDVNALTEEGKAEAFVRQDIVEWLRKDGLTIPQNVIVIGTINMDDTTQSFSRKVIDRAMTFETNVMTFEPDSLTESIEQGYFLKPLPGSLFIGDEVQSSLMLQEGRFSLEQEEKQSIVDFINNINNDLDSTPFQISYRILNETILLYRSQKLVSELLQSGNYDVKNINVSLNLNQVFDDILIQKVLPRIEGDFEKCNACLENLKNRCVLNQWPKSQNKILFMINKFGSDRSGFTSFWN